MNTIKIALVLAASLMLAGCFVSEDPLITIADSDQPVMPGRYSAYEVDDEGGFNDPDDPWTGDIIYRDGYLHSDADDMPLQGALFRTLAPGIHVAMGGDPDDNDEPYSYLLVFTWPDGRIAIHLAICANLSEAAVRELGIQSDDNDTCALSSWDQAEATFLTYLRENEGDIPPSVVMYPAE